MQKIKIHFVCRGNIYLSRLAEAVLKSQKGSLWDITSSGISADKHQTLLVSTRTTLTAREAGLTDFLNSARTQTTGVTLQQSNIIVFMNKDVYEDAKKHYDFNDNLALVWHVNDERDWPKAMPAKQKRRRTLRQIQRGVDTLIGQVTRGSWVDIVDEKNEPRGFKLPISIANQKSLWYRGCHAIITTPERKTILELRSKTIFFSPNLIDITLGGAVDSEETPKESIIREIKEEIGLSVHPSNVRLLEVYKWSKYHPRYKRHSKVFLYTYHVPIDEEEPRLSLQTEEVQAVKFISPSGLKRLLRLHRLRHFGRLNHWFAYFLRTAKLAGLI